MKKKILARFRRIVGAVSSWILTTGFWDDSGEWDDSDVWID